MYIVAEDVCLKHKALTGVLELLEDRISITGPTKLSLPIDTISDVRILRLFMRGLTLRVRCPQTTVFLTVTRINLFGAVALVDFFKTRELLAKLKQATMIEPA